MLVEELIPRILTHIRSILQSHAYIINGDVFETHPGFLFWSKMMEAIKDPYAVERMSEQILLSLSSKQTSNVEAYWTLRILFHQKSVRYMYMIPTRTFFAWEVYIVL